MLIAATPLDPPVDGNCWAFHVINDSASPIASLVLETVDYEWGDMGNEKSVGHRFGPIPAGGCLEIWRDDDDAAELRTTLTVIADGQKFTAEFPKLYKVRTLPPIPLLGRDGYVGSLSKG